MADTAKASPPPSSMRSSSGSQQALGLFGHVTLLQMPDQFGGTLARAVAHPLKVARFGHAAEVVANGRFPTHRNHVEAGRPRQTVGLRQTCLQPVLADTPTAIGIGLFVKRVDDEADAMGQQVHAAGAYRHQLPCSLFLTLWIKQCGKEGRLMAMLQFITRRPWIAISVNQVY